MRQLTYEPSAAAFCSARFTRNFIMDTLEWLHNKIKEGKGTIAFGLTDDGDIGLWRGDQLLGYGDTAVDALNDAATTRCPHCKSPVLFSEDRGIHCDGCDDFDSETDLPNVPDETPRTPIHE